jgi:PAS domain S-box-containing protein
MQPAEHYQALFDRFPTMIWRSRPPEGLCDWFNATWLEFRGRTLEQEAGNGWLEDGVHPDDQERVQSDYREAFQARRAFSIEYRLRRHDGAWRWIEDLGRPLEEPGGAFGGFMGACYDITDRWEAIERLEAAQDAQTLLLQTAFHDIAAPLATATAALDTLPRLPVERRDSMLDIVANQLRRLQRLIDGLRDLDLARHGRLRPRPASVPLRDLVAGVVDAIDPAGRNVKVDVEDRTVVVGPVMTERILENLLTNAVRHTPRGTTIEVTVRETGAAIEVLVEDDGPGLPRDMLADVFAPFAQDATGGGRFGLGLSLVHRYAEAHGGRVTVANRRPRGARFVVRLPLLELPEADTEDAEVRGPLDALGRSGRDDQATPSSPHP